jgi:hypothetical protein
VEKAVTGNGLPQTVALNDDQALILGQGDITVTATQVDGTGNVQTAEAATETFTLFIPPKAPGLAVSPGAANATMAEAIAGAVNVTGALNATITVIFTNAGDPGNPEKTVTISDLAGTVDAQFVTLTEADALKLGQGKVNVVATQSYASDPTQTSVPVTTSFVLDTVAPVFTGQLDKTFKVGEVVNLVLPASVEPPGGLTYAAVDRTGNLGKMGLTLDSKTGSITGVVTSPSKSDPGLYDSWVEVTISDTAGNQSTDAFHISVVDSVKDPVANNFTLSTAYFTSANPQVFKYAGTDVAQSVVLLQSYRDVIELAGGNDTVNLFGNEFGINSVGSSGKMNFARLDGGDGAGDKIVFKFAGETDFILSSFNRPGEDRQGQVLVNFETLDASSATANVRLTVTPLDLFLQGSDFFDSNANGDAVSRSTLVFKGTNTDKLILPGVDVSSADAQDQDFVQVGADGAWDVSGALLTEAAVAPRFTKLQAVVAVGGAEHSVELLFSVEIPVFSVPELTRSPYPFIA